MTTLRRSECPFNESDSFDALVRAHYGRLCTFAYRFVGSRDVAEDIVQDIFARLWRNRATFESWDDPLPYLYRAVRNRTSSHQRQVIVRERWHQRAAATADERPATASATSDLDVRDLATALAAAIDAMPKRRRLIFVMSREQHLSYAEIARILGLSVKTVETQMGRALKFLRTRLADYLAVIVAIAAGWQ